jgi:hypothetical protein
MGASYGVRSSISKRVYKYQRPNTQNCYSFIRRIISLEAEFGLVITLGKLGRV